jgi:hypothetical protein
MVTLTVGTGWSTHFSGTFRAMLRRRLRYAYRAPAFFADESLRSGWTVKFVRFDGEFELDDLDGTRNALAESVELLYIASHGTTGANGYSAILHGTDWFPAALGTGGKRPVVSVFDTCDLLDPNEPNWRTHWEKPSVGKALRLVLGFSSPATCGQATTVRGRAFVENLVAHRQNFVDAWTNAIVATSYQGTDHPVAIAFGDTAADARQIIANASLASIPAPRIANQPTVERFP